MERASRSAPVIRFGSFEVDLRAEELRKNGAKIRLRGQPFQVLAMLLERPGEIVTREELQQRLWPDGTFVDFDHSLNTAINKIREVLGDSAESPRFVETLARRGYRFIAAVETVGRDIQAQKRDADVLLSEKERAEKRTSERLTQEFIAPLQSLGGPAAGEETPAEGERFPQQPLDIGEGRTASVEHPVAQASDVETIATRGRKRTLHWVVAGLLIVISLILGALFWRSMQPVSQPLIRLSVELADFAVVSSGPSAILSPDGTRVVYTGRGADGKSRLYTRMLNQGQATPLVGTENCEMPFISPDGQWIGFFANEGFAGSYKLKKISVEGGAAFVLSDAVDSLGGSWGEDGNIVTALDLHAGLSRVPSGGGAVQPVMELQPQKRKLLHMWPQVLAGAEAVLFTASTAYWDESISTIDVQSLQTGEVKTLVRPGYCGRYAPTGHLLYLRSGTLYAAPMDLGRLELTGPVAQVLENVANDGFDIDSSRSGTLVYVPEKTSNQMLVWLDSDGQAQPLRAAVARYDWTCRFSPDGRRLALSIVQDGNADLWVYEWERDTLTRLTSAPGTDSSPVWSPDGIHIAFSSTRQGGPQNLYWIRADGSGETVRLTESNNMQLPCSITPDGKRLAFQELNPQTNWDLWTLPLEDGKGDHPKPGKPEPFLVTPSNEWFPMISPDGRWLAYNSNEPGRLEIQVRRFAGPEGKWQISTSGGGFPVWSKKEQDLFYLSDQGVMVASYKASGEAFVVAKPRPWTEKKDLGAFDLAPDGQRIVMVQEVEPKGKRPTHVTFLLNFFDELRRLAPAGSK